MSSYDPQSNQPPAAQNYVPPLTNAPHGPGYHVPAEGAAPSGRGKILVLAVLATVLLLQLAVAGLTLSRLGPERLNNSLVRIVINIALSVFLYQGRPWARLVMVILLGLGALIAVVGGVQVLGLGGGAWALFGMGAIYGVCAGLLVFSESVQEFLRRQEARR